LQIRDIFSSAKYNSSSEGPDFYFESYRTRESPVVMLNISINFNDYDKDKKRREQSENGSEDEDDF
jgi:hypothetical protein